MYIGNTHTVGTCSICGGRVTVPMVFWSVVPPEPRCSVCGAAPRASHGHVIDMEPKWALTRWYTGTPITYSESPYRKAWTQLSKNVRQ